MRNDINISIFDKFSIHSPVLTQIRVSTNRGNALLRKINVERIYTKMEKQAMSRMKNCLSMPFKHTCLFHFKRRFIAVQKCKLGVKRKIFFINMHGIAIFCVFLTRVEWFIWQAIWVCSILVISIF